MARQSLTDEAPQGRSESSSAQSWVDRLSVPLAPRMPPLKVDKSLWEVHAHFLLICEGPREDLTAKLAERAETEIRTLVQFVPEERSSQVVQAMAAWFSYSCALDDLVERQNGPQTRALLDSILPTFSEAIDGARVSDRYAPAPKVSSPTTTACRLSEALYHHLKTLLTRKVFVSACEEIRIVLESFIEESRFRENGFRDTAEYLALRQKTIGLGPWLPMLGANIQGDPTSETERCLAELRSCVTRAVGLQNDICGLMGDLNKGDTMNFVYVYHYPRLLSPIGDRLSSRDPDEYRCGSLVAADEHNAATASAKDAYERLCIRGSAAEKLFARHLYHLTATHLLWARESERYKTSRELAPPLQ